MQNSTKIFIGLIVLLIVVVAIFSSGKSPVQVDSDKIKIGVILPLTGGSASAGNDVKYGIEMAARSLGKEANRFELIYQDDKCDPKEGLNSYHNIIIAGARLIIGPVCSQSTLAVAPLAEQAKILIFTPLSAADAVSQAGDYIFRNHVRESQEQAKMVEYLLTKYKTAATIRDTASEATVSSEKAFTEMFEAAGGKVVARESYRTGDSDFKAQLIKIKNTKPEVVQLSCLMPEIVQVIKQMKELGIEALLVSDNVVTDSKFLSEAGSLSEGVIFAASDFKRETSPDFWDSFKKEVGKNPNIFAAQGYDTYMILTKLIKEKCPNGDPTCLKDELYKVKDYPGVSGITTFDSNGDAVKPVVIKTIKGGQFVEVGP